MVKKILDLVFCVIFSVCVVYIWMYVFGVLLAVAIPEIYVKNPDGSYHGKAYVLLIWDFFVVHFPSFLFPCFTLSLAFRLWVVSNSKVILGTFVFVYSGSYIYSLYTSLPVIYPPGILQKIYSMLPTPYPFLGVLLGVWLGSRLKNRKTTSEV